MDTSEAFLEYIQNVIVYEGQAYKTMVNCRTSMKSFLELVGEVNITDLNFEHVALWRQLMEEKGYKPSTISANICKLRCVVQYCNLRGYTQMKKEDIKVPRVPKRNPEWLEPEEIREIINHTEEGRDRSLISLLFSTGCRVGEIIGANRDDIHDDYMIVHGKGDKYRPVFFDETTKGYLEAYLGTRTDDLPFLFTSHQRKRLTVSRAQQILTKASEGMSKHVYPHMLRHSYASNAAAQGMPITMLKEILGHENITTTMMYVHSSLKGRQEAYLKYAVTY